MVSIAPPQRWLNRIPASCGKVAAKFRARTSNVSGRRSCAGADPVAGVVDRVVAAPQDPVVGRAPEVVELVAGVGHPLAAAPADRSPRCAGRQRLGHQRVVVDGHEHRDEPPQPAAVRRRPDEHLRGRDHAPARRRGPRRRPPAAAGRSTRDPSKIRPAAALHGPCEAPGELGRVQHHGALGRRPAPRRGTAASGPPPGSRRARGSGPGCRAGAASSANAAQLVDLVGLGRDIERARLLQLAVDPLRPHEGDQRRRGSPAPSRSSTSISSGKCSSPLASPWVSEAAQKPPLRPLAPQPTRSASRTATRRDGIRLEQRDRRPQAGEPAADDRDIHRVPADGRGPARARVARS